MIDGFLYIYIYMIFVWILTVSTVNHYYRTNRYLDYRKASSNVHTFLIILIFFIGLRPNSYVFVDHMNYYVEYQGHYGDPAYYSLDTENFLFDNILPFFSSNKIPVEFYFLLIAAIYFSGIAWASRKMFPNDTLLAFVMYLPLGTDDPSIRNLRSRTRPLMS